MMQIHIFLFRAPTLRSSTPLTRWKCCENTQFKCWGESQTPALMRWTISACGGWWEVHVDREFPCVHVCACTRTCVCPLSFIQLTIHGSYFSLLPVSSNVSPFVCHLSPSPSHTHGHAHTHTRTRTHTRSCGLESILCFLVSSERPSRALGARPSNEPPAAQRSSCHRGETTSRPSHVISAGTRARAAASLKGFSAAEREIPISHSEHPSLNRC